MLLYLDKKRAPNPRKLRIYLAEKKLDIPIKELDLYAGEQKTPEFLAKNPFAGVPILELDDGTVLIETLPIMEYLEELYPDPPLVGADPVSRALARSWERRCEIGVYLTASRMVLSKGDVSDQARKVLMHRLPLVNAGLEGYAGGYEDIFYAIVFHDHLGSLAGGRVIRLGRRHDTYGSQGRNDHHRRQ